MTSKIGASEYVKGLGGKSVAGVARAWGCDPDTIHNWYSQRLDRVKIATLGSIAIEHGITGDDIKNLAKIKGGTI